MGAEVVDVPKLLLRGEVILEPTAKLPELSLHTADRVFSFGSTPMPGKVLNSVVYACKKIEN
jgi:hypothetical protein